MIPEGIFAAIAVLVLLRMLFPELFRPAPASGVISGGMSYSDAPVANATVTLYTPDKLTEVAIATSGADGKYTLAEVAAGNYHITAILRNADGTWLQADKDVVIDAPTVTVDLIMERTTILNIEPSYHPSMSQLPDWQWWHPFFRHNRWAAQALLLHLPLFIKTI